MSEIIDADVLIDVGAAVGLAVVGLVAACAVTGIAVGRAVGQITKGVSEGFTDEMQAAVDRLAPIEQSEPESVPVDGIRCLRTIRAAVQQMAHDRGGDVIEEITDGAGRKHDVLVGLRFEGAEAGIGVNIDESGRLQIQADPTVVAQSLIDEAKGDLETTYTAIGLAEAMEALQYDYGVSRPSRQECVIVGERAE